MHGGIVSYKRNPIGDMLGSAENSSPSLSNFLADAVELGQVRFG